MLDFIQPLISRFVGALIGAGAGYIAAKGIGQVTPETASNLQQVIVNACMLIGYGISHKLTSKKVNPSDAATVGK